MRTSRDGEAEARPKENRCDVISMHLNQQITGTENCNAYNTSMLFMKSLRTRNKMLCIKQSTHNNS